MHIPISPDLERLITEQAQSLGFTAEDYLRTIFGTAVLESALAPLSDKEFARLLDDLSSESDLPSLPADFSRADIYADHD